jgi:PKD repeat protein
MRRILILVMALTLGALQSQASAFTSSMRRLQAEPVTAHRPLRGLALASHGMPLRVPDPRAYAAAKAAAERGYATWRARHPSAGANAGPRTALPGAPGVVSPPPPRVVLFEELNAPGMGAGLYTPPDTTGAIGPSDYVELVNSQIGVYSRTLSLQATESEDEFTGGTASCDGQIRWDQQAERWEYASLECGEPTGSSQGFNFGWSKTADPTNLSAGWCKFHFPTGSVLADYPKLGGDDDFMIIGANGFESGAFVGSKVFAIPKPAPGASTCPGSLPVLRGGVPVFTPVPANTFGSSTTGYIVAGEYEPNGAANKLSLFALTKDAGGALLTEEPTVTVSPYFLPAPVPQPGTTDGIDSSDTRLTQAVAAEDPKLHQLAVWTQHTISESPGAPSVVRWYEVTAGSSTPVQEGTVAASGGNFAFNGAISPTANGNGAVVDYNIGGSAQQVELHAQSRGPATPAGTTGGDVLLAKSDAIDQDFTCPSITPADPSCRWGDYAGASPDPVHPGVVWGTGEVNGPIVAGNAPQWKTQNFALAVHASPVAAFSVPTASPTGGAPVSFDASASSDPGESIAAYEWSFGDGTSGGGEKPTHTYAAPGVYRVTLTVKDEAGFTATVEHEVTIADAPPVAAFSVTSATQMATVPMSFDGSGSHDPDGTIVSYDWSFGDGTGAGGVAPSHTYATAGNYTVTLTVTDNGGKTTSISHEVAVAAVPAPPTQPSGAGVNTGGASTTGSGGVGGSKASTSPSNTVRVTGIKQNKRNGSVALSVLVPDGGALSARDASSARSASLISPLPGASSLVEGPVAVVTRTKGKAKSKPVLVKPVSVSVAEAGTVTLRIVPTTTASAQLERKHKLGVKVLISFTPAGGMQGAMVQPVTLLLAAGTKRHR